MSSGSTSILSITAMFDGLTPTQLELIQSIGEITDHSQGEILKKVFHLCLVLYMELIQMIKTFHWQNASAIFFVNVDISDHLNPLCVLQMKVGLCGNLKSEGNEMYVH